MPDHSPCMEEAKGITSGIRRIALCMTQEEADALLHLLLHAPPSPQVPGEITEHLLVQVAEVQREFARDPGPGPNRAVKLNGSSHISTARRRRPRRNRTGESPGQ
jgi:hypothetical protein